MKRKLFACAVLAVGLAGLPAAAAEAAPKPRAEVTLYCGDEVVPVSVNGNGAWTPAHALENNLVGVPIAFGELHITFTPKVGDPVHSTEPATAKPNPPKSRNLIVECSFIYSATLPDGNVLATGDVTLMVPRIHV